MSLHHNFLYPFFKKNFESILSVNDVAGLTQKINRKQIQLVSKKVQTFGLYNERDHSFRGIYWWSHTWCGYLQVIVVGLGFNLQLLRFTGMTTSPASMEKTEARIIANDKSISPNIPANIAPRAAKPSPKDEIKPSVVDSRCPIFSNAIAMITGRIDSISSPAKIRTGNIVM